MATVVLSDRSSGPMAPPQLPDNLTFPSPPPVSFAGVRCGSPPSLLGPIMTRRRHFFRRETSLSVSHRAGRWKRSRLRHPPTKPKPVVDLCPRDTLERLGKPQNMRENWRRVRMRPAGAGLNPDFPRVPPRNQQIPRPPCAQGIEGTAPTPKPPSSPALRRPQRAREWRRGVRRARRRCREERGAVERTASV